LDPAIRQRDSVSSAEERRTVFSRTRERSASVVVGLHMQALEKWSKGLRYRDLYRPTSKAGEAKGESSVDMVKIPSNLRSGKGVVTSAEMRTTTLHTRTSYYLFQ